MLQAKDIMTSKVFSISPEASVEEAAEIMSREKISGLPVVDNEKLVGIITEKDLIYKDKKLHFPDFINVLGGIIYLESHKKFEEEFKKFVAIKVEELMTRDVYNIKPETPIDKIADLMTDRDVNRLPVINEKYHLLGIVTRNDIVRNMTRKQ